MRLLVVGAGSIGRRHAANAAALAETAVLDSDAARCREVAQSCGATALESLEAALAWRADGAVVATPNASHVPVAEALLGAGAEVLIEKPLAADADSAAALLERARAAGRRVWVACNMRFHPGPAALRRHLEAIGRPLFARAHFGHWLPAMRPGADYRALYCARAQDGGGVVLDGIHEIDYLCWLLGEVIECSARTARLSDLEIDVEDWAALTLTHAGGVRSEVHLDYLQQLKRRGCEIAGSEGTLLWRSEGRSPEACSVRLYRRDTGHWESLVDTPSVDTAAPYRALMERFVAALRGEPADALLDGAAALRELRVALAARSGGGLRRTPRAAEHPA